MRNYSKLLLGALCALSSASLFAFENENVYKSYKDETLPVFTSLTIPNFEGGVEFTVEGLYLRPTLTNTRYLTVFESLASPNSTQVETYRHNVDPEYDWGFLIGLGYIFPNTGNDVQASWMQFDNDNSESLNIKGPKSGFILNPSLFAGGLSSSETLSAKGEINTDFDAIDLTFGQFINIGPRLQTRLFGGLRYMKLESGLETHYEFSGGNQFRASNRAIANMTISGDVNSKFNGLGPLFGMKADYNLGWGLGISALFDAALLVGNLSFDADYGVAGGAPVFAINEISREINVDDTSIIAPGFDARFGLNYKYYIKNGSRVDLEIGYQVTKYIDVIQQLDGVSSDFICATSAVCIAPAENGGITETDITNFGLNGLYLSLNVKV